MEFEYEVYYRQNCVVPLALWIFTGIGVIYLIICLFGTIKGQGFTVKKILYEVAVLALILVPLFSINTIMLLRGGIFLLVEKESDKVTITGTIEETGEIDFYTGYKYEVDQNRGSGETITVDGVKYYLVTYGDLKSGDTVTLEVLPKSKLILSIWKTN